MQGPTVLCGARAARIVGAGGVCIAPYSCGPLIRRKNTMGRHAICPPRRLYVSTLAGDSRNGVGTTYAFENPRWAPRHVAGAGVWWNPQFLRHGTALGGPRRGTPHRKRHERREQLSASYGISTFLKDSTTRTRFFVPAPQPALRVLHRDGRRHATARRDVRGIFLLLQRTLRRAQPSAQSAWLGCSGLCDALEEGAATRG